MGLRLKRRLPRPFAILKAFTLIALESLQGQLQATDYRSRDVVVFNEREALPNVFAKLAEGAEVRVAYLGGSITEQPGWRVKSLLWFQTQFPSAEVKEINAAVGGTGSDLGAFRVDSDVIEKRPDLLFVEFAVNDRSTESDVIRKAVEGIVRKTWKARPDCDICFIYTITKDDIEGLKIGRMKRSERVMEEVADHYGIPSIHLGVDVARLEKDGRLIMEFHDTNYEQKSSGPAERTAQPPNEQEAPMVFSKDGVHPYLDTGHALYAATISHAMESIRGHATRRVHELGVPLSRDNWEYARMIAFDQTAALEGDVVKLDSAHSILTARFAQRLPGLWELKPGATLRFKFIGTEVAIYDLMGPDCGLVEVTLDGNTRKVMRFDSYSTCHRLSTLKVGGNLEYNKHDVKIKVLEDKFDKERLLAQSHRGNFSKNHATYEGSNWYAGAILLVGEVVK
jgi:hypothetical protein